MQNRCGYGKNNIMKKKYRTLHLNDGNNWAWGILNGKPYDDYYYEYSILKIWKNKVCVYSKGVGAIGFDELTWRYKLTPGLMVRFINRFLKQ